MQTPCHCKAAEPAPNVFSGVISCLHFMNLTQHICDETVLRKQVSELVIALTAFGTAEAFAVSHALPRLCRFCCELQGEQKSLSVTAAAKWRLQKSDA